MKCACVRRTGGRRWRMPLLPPLRAPPLQLSQLPQPGADLGMVTLKLPQPRADLGVMIWKRVQES
eukprot:scaffold264091_cov13-Tisochrysis_lutea.AAC.1